MRFELVQTANSSISDKLAKINGQLMELATRLARPRINVQKRKFSNSLILDNII